jgi:hypothetical protein
LENILDSKGLYGEFMHWALVLAFVGSAFVVFLYLWKKGRLDMDEEPKIQMMKDDDELNDKGETNV